MTPAQRVNVATNAGARLHDRYRASVETGVSMCWGNMPLTRGGITSVLAADMAKYTPILTRAEGRTRLAGEHASYLCGWMAGAIESGRYAAEAIHAQHEAALPQHAPA